ncbi:hypothetical protein DFH08DRAFT_965297 [Mycena albidolilacea]|uniref:HIT-type domain-containing protein n=1 Tax=Mycena albidolilacea TaxID=1033008 RepID=A0AAD6ZRW0_9AGAR|nr:hypothetical protein DFH08DRAFT_965297 [Mycena albidolilacea]
MHNTALYDTCTSPIRDATPPALTSLSRLSRLCSVPVVCATCRTPGTNFPACPRCSAAWCSLACRLRHGARQVCPAAATLNPSPSRPGTGMSKSPLVLTPMPITITLPLVRTLPPNREADVQRFGEYSPTPFIFDSGHQAALGL